MTGSLSREVLDALERAGYVAIPKECVEKLWVETQVLTQEMLNSVHYGSEYKHHIQKSIAYQMVGELIKRDYIDAEVFLPDKNGPFTYRHRAELTVVKPRVIK